MKYPILRWGIIGPGKIAHSFAQDLKLHETHVIKAVGSRSVQRAKAFADCYNIPKHYGSYFDLLADSEIDIIYIATPHHEHKKWTLISLDAGKHVLCEKPIGVNVSEMIEMKSKAINKNLFLMEALWTRFIPGMIEVKKSIDQGKIGDVDYLFADFAFFSEHSDESRLFSPQLAGGALLDIGIYPLFLSYFILGLPQKIKSTSHIYHTGVDVRTAMQLVYPKSMSLLYCGLQSTSDMRARIHGTKGRIEIHPRWHETQGFDIISNTGFVETFVHPKHGKGYFHEIEACYQALNKGWVEHPYWTWQNSIDLIQMMDEIRSQNNIVFPFEEI